MKRLIFLLIPLFAAAIFAQDLPKIAVYVTGDLEGNEKKVLEARMLVALVNSGRYRDAERNAAFLTEADKERQNRGEAFDNRHIGELGRLFDINYVCVAEVTPAFGEFYVAVRVVNTETATTEHIGVAASPLKSISDIELVSELAVKNMFSRQTAAVKSAPAPEPDPVAQAPAQPLTTSPVYAPATPSTSLSKDPPKAAVYVTGIPDMVAKPFNSAVSSALMKTKIYAGIESIDVSGAPGISALVTAGNNAGVSYIFAINVSGQISVAIIDVVKAAELAKTTIDGKITAVNATIIAKKTVDFILKSGPKPAAQTQVYPDSAIQDTAQGRMQYKTKYLRLPYIEQDGKPRWLKTSFRFDAGGVFSPYSSVKTTQTIYYSDHDSVRHISGSGIGYGYDFNFIWKYVEIGFNIVHVAKDNVSTGGMDLLGKYPFILPSWDFVRVSPVLGISSRFTNGGYVLGSKVDVGISELAYLRSEYLWWVLDLLHIGMFSGMSFKLGAGLDVGLGKSKKAYLNPELLYCWEGNRYDPEYNASVHTLNLRLSIGYRRGDARKAVKVPVKIIPD